MIDRWLRRPWLLLALLAGLGSAVLQWMLLGSMQWSNTQICIGLFFPPLLGTLLGRQLAPQRWNGFFQLAWLCWGGSGLLFRFAYLQAAALLFALASLFLAQSLSMAARLPADDMS
ncbi:hypothetical protein SAMN02745857_03874 [Andreprevotia lacus DSM 23236]|jgi:hypothetical protein|uniref:Uncharacterized protein n=1 Tax=Andreprevotia lacus DSM 23236 TaxID=1121001 RepID=A0A1W1XZU2_9NEIS|nr:hypothetical protein [Andreprevotia lacus]SMC29489.1 hypothetical protein SAMN02745857_03874 [Andreprevotia lacus DSM 23236]